VEGNPLKDITSMSKIRTVIMNGKIKYSHSNNINVS